MFSTLQPSTICLSLSPTSLPKTRESLDISNLAETREQPYLALHFSPLFRSLVSHGVQVKCVPLQDEQLSRICVIPIQNLIKQFNFQFKSGRTTLFQIQPPSVISGLRRLQGRISLSPPDPVRKRGGQQSLHERPLERGQGGHVSRHARHRPGMEGPSARLKYLL